MKYITKLTALLLLSSFIFSFKKMEAKDGSYHIDLVKSGMKWQIKTTIGGHNGTIKIKEGSLTYHGGNISSGAFVIDINSVKDLDLDKEKQPKLEAHLRSPDFFDAAKYPVINFRITKVESKGGQDFQATGSLTIKSITKQISFPCTIKTADNHVYVDAKGISINRKDYGVHIENKGLKGSMEEMAIHNDFTVDFSIVLDQ